ncbi:MAG: DNRLRE domain-containing protein [Chloroflexota bacterium]|nr:DNRLRE domain-containing protein [Chloroflexota bacterium]
MTPVADTRINRLSPTTGYATVTTLRTDADDYESLLRFEVTGLSGPVSALLRVFITDASTVGPSIYATSSAWSESVTWNTAPPAGTMLGKLPAGSAGEWIDATVSVPGNGAFSVRMSTSSSDGMSFASRESSNRPQLIISTASPSATPTPTPTPSIAPTTLVGAGDIASCSSSGDEATAKLLDGISGTVFTAGDNAYESGSAQQYADCYAPSWGRHKARTRPTPGNHEYGTSGASGYFAYFNVQSYYAYDLGTWRVYALNSNVARGTASAQVQWLRNDLAANPRRCVAAYWHHPRFSSSSHGDDTSVSTLVQTLYDANADIIIGAHDHFYERYAPIDPTGAADPQRGVRHFVVGTGGASHYGITRTRRASSEVANSTAYGVLQLALWDRSYEWKFVPIGGQSFTDSGRSTCH